MSSPITANAANYNLTKIIINIILTTKFEPAITQITPLNANKE